MAKTIMVIHGMRNYTPPLRNTFLSEPTLSANKVLWIKGLRSICRKPFIILTKIIATWICSAGKEQYLCSIRYFSRFRLTV
jgi:hypothetical protein